ncbi:hypothetical protein NOV72_01368 [Caballeronia novacaledonica]|uniref:Purine nucleoside phosphorylase n=1 Tax=Caballeronia novacaledonica TaxID=1544861 RepID=A0A2U3I1Z3_9BURK|nr:DUF4148 domain-containing protein [Caballeronia novacaledonica]SPB14119.1 hypothetical protein NOV72_01368 [Caballeronia novacaledonica]
MKSSTLLASLVIAALSGSVWAQSAQAQGKTREQVKQELLKAQHDGIIPTGKHNYPPTETTIARNKELHQISKHTSRSDASAALHDTVSAR